MGAAHTGDQLSTWPIPLLLNPLSATVIHGADKTAAWSGLGRHPGTMDQVGGYRLVRKLAEGSRASLVLGHPGAQAVGITGVSTAELASSVAVLKIYRPTTSMASIDREISALESVTSRHILAIRDVATGEDGRPCLILPRLSSLSLGRLLAIRSSLSAGEASTLLVPLIESVRLLHRAGVTHGALRLDAVLFDGYGAPVLCRFGRAQIIAGDDAPSVARLDQDDNTIEDRISLRCIVASVLARIEPGVQSAAVSEVRRWLADGLAVERSEAAGSTFAHGDLDFLATLVFDFATPCPILFSDPGPGGASGVPTEVRFPDPWRDFEPQSGAQQLFQAPARNRLPIAQLRAAMNLPPWLDAAIERVVGGITCARPALWAHKVLSPVRRSVWIVGLIGLGAIVVAFAAMPAAPPRSTQPPAAEHQIVGDPVPGETPGSASGDDQSADEGVADRVAERAGAVAGDDPLAAADALIIIRNDCFAALNIACLAGVDQVGSPFHDADIHLIGRLTAGATLSSASSLAGQLNLVQQLGNSAILTLQPPSQSPQQNPVPLLVVRNETGWRIRDADFG